MLVWRRNSPLSIFTSIQALSLDCPAHYLRRRRCSTTHTYTRTGTYDLKLTVSSKGGTRSITKVINVVTQPTIYVNPYAHDQQDGFPPVNPAVTLPTPNDQLSDKVTTTTAATATASNPPTSTSSSTSSTTSSAIGWIVGGLILALLIGGIVVVFVRRKAQV